MEAYKDIEKLKGKKVVIIGGGAIGCESGYFFASECGAKVQILEMRDAMCKDSYPSQRAALLPRMDKAGMILDCSVTTKEITENGVKFLDKDGNEQFVPCDVVVMSSGMRPRQDLAESFRMTAPDFMPIGDCVIAKNVRTATRMAFDAATRI